MDLLWSASGKLRQGFSSFRGLVVSGVSHWVLRAANRWRRERLGCPLGLIPARPPGDRATGGKRRCAGFDVSTGTFVSS